MRPLHTEPMMIRLMLLGVLACSGFCLTLPSIPLHAVRNGADAATAGLPTTVMLATTAAGHLLIPWLGRRTEPGRLLVSGLVLLGLPSPLLLLAPRVDWLSAIAALRGCGFAIVTVLGVTMTARIAPPGQRGKAIGLYGVAVALPNIVVIPLATALTTAGHFPVVAWAAATPLLAVVVVPALARVTPAAAPAARPRPRRTDALRAVPASATLSLAALVAGGILTFLPLALPPGSTASVGLFVFGACAAVSRWLVGHADQRGPAPRLLSRAIMLTVLGMLSLAAAIAAIAADPRGLGGVMMLMASMALTGIGYGATQSLTLIAAFEATERDTVASMMWNLGFDAGTALGAVGVGTLTGLGVGFAWAFGASTLALLPALGFVALARMIQGGTE